MSQSERDYEEVLRRERETVRQRAQRAYQAMDRVAIIMAGAVAVMLRFPGGQFEHDRIEQPYLAWMALATAAITAVLVLGGHIASARCAEAEMKTISKSSRSNRLAGAEADDAAARQEKQAAVEAERWDKGVRWLNHGTAVAAILTVITTGMFIGCNLTEEKTAMPQNPTTDTRQPTTEHRGEPGSATENRPLPPPQPPPQTQK